MIETVGSDRPKSSLLERNILPVAVDFLARQNVISGAVAVGVGVT